MKRIIIELPDFIRKIDDLIEKMKLNTSDFEDLKCHLAQYPDSGSLITGTGGLRKTRLKSQSKGKRGGTNS